MGEGVKVDGRRCRIVLSWWSRLGGRRREDVRRRRSDVRRVEEEERSDIFLRRLLEVECALKRRAKGSRDVFGAGYWRRQRLSVFIDLDCGWIHLDDEPVWDSEQLLHFTPAELFLGCLSSQADPRIGLDSAEGSLDLPSDVKLGLKESCSVPSEVMERIGSALQNVQGRKSCERKRSEVREGSQPCTVRRFLTDLEAG